MQREICTANASAVRVGRITKGGDGCYTAAARSGDIAIDKPIDPIGEQNGGVILRDKRPGTSAVDGIRSARRDGYRVCAGINFFNVKRCMRGLGIENGSEREGDNTVRAGIDI